MRTSAKRMAACSMMAALSVVLMVLGAILELGMYACPLFAGLCFIPIGQKYGRKYHIILYAASSILCFLMVPNMEQTLMFAGLFGWYPIVRPVLQTLPKFIRWICKLAIFNVVAIAIEWLVMTVLVPDVKGDPLFWVLLILDNLIFLAYDFMIPKTQILTGRISKLL